MPKPSRMTLPRNGVVGKLEMARMFDFGDRVAHIWKQRNRLPPSDVDSVSGHPAWLRDTVLVWAVETGRDRYLVDPDDRRRAAELTADDDTAAA